MWFSIHAGGKWSTNLLSVAPRYRDAPRAVAFLKEAFGFEEHALHRDGEGVIAHAEMPHGNGAILFGQARPEPGNPWAERSGIYVVVEEVDAHHARAAAAGAQIVSVPRDTGYGSREDTARDLDGNLWSFGTYRP
jgi:uncharacterized glyoxalase superfamily protein PhnB